jgi:hypothetical protein
MNKLFLTCEEALDMLHREFEVILDCVDGDAERIAQWWEKVYGESPDLAQQGESLSLVVNTQPLMDRGSL